MKIDLRYAHHRRTLEKPKRVVVCTEPGSARTHIATVPGGTRHFKGNPCLPCDAKHFYDVFDNPKDKRDYYRQQRCKKC